MELVGIELEEFRQRRPRAEKHEGSEEPQSINFGGADRDRTGGLVVANDALSQLSYSPT